MLDSTILCVIGICCFSRLSVVRVHLCLGTYRNYICNTGAFRLVIRWLSRVSCLTVRTPVQLEHSSCPIQPLSALFCDRTAFTASIECHLLHATHNASASFFKLCVDRRYPRTRCSDASLTSHPSAATRQRSVAVWWASVVVCQLKVGVI